jgi:EPS-associated MarR family transcriptional regulator
VPTTTKTLTENTTNTGTKLQVLRALQDKPDMTQRELAQKLGVSLGRVNYCIKALVDKGYVKVGNFAASNNKLRYAYILTPSGVAEKASLTTAFIARKLSEYHALRAEIATLVKAGELDADELDRVGSATSR